MCGSSKHSNYDWNDFLVFEKRFSIEEIVLKGNVFLLQQANSFWYKQKIPDHKIGFGTIQMAENMIQLCEMRYEAK